MAEAISDGVWMVSFVGILQTESALKVIGCSPADSAAAKFNPQKPFAGKTQDRPGLRRHRSGKSEPSHTRSLHRLFGSHGHVAFSVRADGGAGGILLLNCCQSASVAL